MLYRCNEKNEHTPDPRRREVTSRITHSECNYSNSPKVFLCPLSSDLCTMHDRTRPSRPKNKAVCLHAVISQTTTPFIPLIHLPTTTHGVSRCPPSSQPQTATATHARVSRWVGSCLGLGGSRVILCFLSLLSCYFSVTNYRTTSITQKYLGLLMLYLAL